MATSGTYSFQMARDDLILAALRKTGAFGALDTPSQADMSFCAQALNVIMKELPTNGDLLHCRQDLAVPLVAGQATYDLSALTGETLPIRILDAYLRGPMGNDVALLLVSRYDYDTLGMKSSSGVPNQLIYDPQVGSGLVTLYNVPADSTRTLHVLIQRQLMDVNLSTDNVDFPQTAFRMLVWILADEIALEYQTPADDRAEIAAKASAFKDRLFDSNVEQASVYFTGSERVR